MKKITKTITEERVVGYEAFDGTTFFSEAECKKYEESAVGVASKLAWAYLVRECSADEFFDSGEISFLVFDVPDEKAYCAIANWAHLEGAWDAGEFTPDYIGKRVAFHHCYGSELCFSKWCATEEAATNFYLNAIRRVFADKEKEGDN